MAHTNANDRLHPPTHRWRLTKVKPRNHVRTLHVNVDDQTIVVELHEPENGPPSRTILLMVHGGPGGTIDGPADLFADITPAITERGFAVARFNLRGSGDQPTLDPRRATVRTGIDDVETVFSALRSEPFDRVVLYAESMGATMGLLSSCSSQFAASVLLWPALNLFDTDLREFLVSSKIEAARSTGSLAIGDLSVGLDFLIDCLVFDAGAQVGSLNGPVLIIHGNADEEVPCTHSARAAAILGPDSTRLVIVPGGNHGLKQAHERELVVRESLAFLDALG